MTITYTSSIDWGWESSPTTSQRKSWLARASAFLSDLMPGSEVQTQETEGRSAVTFSGDLPEPLDYSESEVRELLQAEWEAFAATADAPRMKVEFRLRDVLPAEFMHGEYVNTKAYDLRDYLVVAKIDGTESGQGWPGKHAHVMHWYVLASGHIVGFNENPARGWSFPVMRPTGALLARVQALTAAMRKGEP